MRDTPLEIFYSDWQPAQGGLFYPSEVRIALHGVTVHEERRDSVQVNVTLEESLFAFPKGAAPVYNEELARRGATTSQFNLSFNYGVSFYGIETTVNAEELAPGVHFLTGSFHHSIVVEQENGLVVLEAPLYNARSDALIAWIEREFPDKSITHVVSSHFHIDHSGGLRAFVARGATAVVSERTADFFTAALNAPSTIVPDALERNPVDVAIETVPTDGPLTMPDATRPVAVYHVENTHSEDLVMIHLPNEEMVIIADLYSPGNPPLPILATAFYDSIQMHGLAVSTIVGIHGGAGSFTELAESVGR